MGTFTCKKCGAPLLKSIMNFPFCSPKCKREFVSDAAVEIYPEEVKIAKPKIYPDWMDAIEAQLRRYGRSREA
jgi:hypothetical protein